MTAVTVRCNLAWGYGMGYWIISSVLYSAMLSNMASSVPHLTRRFLGCSQYVVAGRLPTTVAGSPMTLGVKLVRMAMYLVKKEVSKATARSTSLVSIQWQNYRLKAGAPPSEFQNFEHCPA